MKQKVTVVGAGNVGATAAQRIVEKEIADVVLIDIIEGIPQGKALDIMESAPVEKFDARMAGSNSYDLSDGSDVVVITAGLPRKPGMSRDDLVADQRGDRRRRRAQGRCRGSPDAILIVVSNPLDAMCEVARRVSGFPRERVFGMAGHPRLGADALVPGRGARRLGREHARLRARRARRHDGAAAALLDGRRDPDHGAPAEGEASTRSSSGRATAASRSSTPEDRRPGTRRPPRSPRWSTRCCGTRRRSCPAPPTSRGSTGCHDVYLGRAGQARARRASSRSSRSR